MHLVVNGSGMAVYRLFCIKNNSLIQGKIKERRLFEVLHVGGLIFTFLLTFMFIYEDSSDRIALNQCSGKSEYVAQIWLDFRIIQGAELALTRTYTVISLSTVIGMTLVEFGCYISFFHLMYTQDNGRITLLLPKDVTRHRNRRNAISFVGHIYSFVVEFGFFAGTLAVHLISNMEVKYFGSVAIFMEFGLLSAVEVLTSEPMRKSIVGNVK